jgi:hypothetical protein
MKKLMYKWKCMDCESMVNHKGLCRDCTEYSDLGDIITPVARVKVDRDGHEIIKNTNVDKTYIFRDGSEGKKGFRGPKRMTKKQMMLADEEAVAMAEAIKQLVDSQDDGEEMLEFGESVTIDEEE